MVKKAIYYHANPITYHLCLALLVYHQYQQVQLVRQVRQVPLCLLVRLRLVVLQGHFLHLYRPVQQVLAHHQRQQVLVLQLVLFLLVALKDKGECQILGFAQHNLN